MDGFFFLLYTRPTVTLCREWLLTRSSPTHAEAKLMLCRSWNCEYCQPRRKRQMLAQAASGCPTRFITLTVNPSVGSDPEERLKLLTHAWRTVMKRIRRAHPGEQIDYFAVVEATVQGEPHLHILFRGPFIPQGQLSDWFRELIQAPIVDIRRIKNVDQAVRYVAKYITKKPAQFGTAKRYWKSPGYELSERPSLPVPPADTGKWVVWRDGLTQLITAWIHDGFAPRSDGDGKWYAIASDYQLREL